MSARLRSAPLAIPAAILIAFLAFIATLAPARAPIGGVNADLAAYALPDGTLPVLCVTGDPATPMSEHGAGPCGACLACAAPIVSDPSAGVARPVATGAAETPTVLAVLPRNGMGTARPRARGPPARASA
jgi:hypothetical protein